MNGVHYNLNITHIVFLNLKGIYMPKLIKDIKIKILEASMDLFDSIGYENLSMRKISEKANIAVGTLYNYFPNKKKSFFRNS